MSDENITNRLTEDEGSLGGDALIHALRRDMQGLFGLVKGLDAKVEALDAKVEALDAKVEALDGRVEALDGRVEALDAKVEARLRDTTPMWQVVVARLDTVIAEQENHGKRLDAIEAEQHRQGARLDAIEGRLDAIDLKLERFDAIDTELRHLRRRIERTIGQLSTDVVGYRVDQHDLEDRIEKLEKTPA